MASNLTRYEDWTNTRQARQHQRYEILRETTLARVFFVHRYRNAWHGWPSANYFPSSCCLNLDGAQRWVEQHRERGSSWMIEEMPALVFTGRRYALLVAPCKLDILQRGWDSKAGTKPHLSNIAESLAEENVMRLIVDAQAAFTVPKRVREYSPWGYGPGPLVWECLEESRFTRAGLARLRRAHRKSLQLPYWGLLHSWRYQTIVSIRVDTLLPASPLLRAGVKPKDRIVAIESAKRRFEEWDIEDGLERIKAGEHVRVHVRRRKESLVFGFVLLSFAQVASRTP